MTRIEQEKKTVRQMVEIYCHGKNMLAKIFAKNALPFSTMPIYVWIIANSVKRNLLAKSVLSIAISWT